MFVALVLLTLTLAISLVNRGFFNPISITLGALAISSGLASLRLFGLYGFDSVALRIILGGSLSVFSGALLVQAAGIRREPRPIYATGQDDLVRYRLLELALAVSIILLVVSRRQQLQILADGGSLSEVRNAYLGYGGANAAIDLADRLFVGPVSTVALPVFLWSLLRRKAEPRFVILFVSVLTLNQITSGGRFIFLYAGIMILALLGQSGRLHLRTARARTILIALCAVVAVFTLARGNALLFEAYTYLSIPVPLLGHWVDIVQDNGIRTGGTSFIYGGLTLIFRLFQMIGSSVGADISAAVALPQNYWVELLPGRYFNAFVTMFYYFFLDFGWAGVYAGGLVWGVLGQWSHRRMWDAGPRATFFGLLMLQVAVMAFVRWEFTNGSLVIALLLLPLFVRSGSARRVVNGDGSRHRSPVAKKEQLTS